MHGIPAQSQQIVPSAKDSGEINGFHIGDARSFSLTSASKFNIEPDGGVFDVSAGNDRASPNVKTLIHVKRSRIDVPRGVSPALRTHPFV